MMGTGTTKGDAALLSPELLIQVQINKFTRVTAFISDFNKIDRVVGDNFRLER